MLPSMRFMLKKWLLTGAFFFVVYFAGAQDRGDFRFGINTYLNTYNFKTYKIYGFDGEYFLSHTFALNYRVGLGSTSDGNMAFHFPVSWLGMAYAADAEALVFLSVVPEGFSLHFYPNERMEVSPFFNLLGSELILGDTEDEFNMLIGTGVRAFFKPNETFSLSASYGVSSNYRGNIFFNAGFSLGFIF